MLTGKNTEPQQAVHYFMEGYYQEGTSRWSGQGAKKLGLSGAVNHQETFSNIVNGRSPDGSQNLCARKLNSSQRRAATDFTFSAPKSVSLQALVHGDERLIAAHQLAVQKTLELIEQRYSYTRATTQQGQQLLRTNNLVVAEFDHIETRELDPHLHTHALVMNITQLENGSWYSLFNDEIFKNKKFLGMVYQNYLALEIEKLGYQVEPKKHGQFEIKGFRDEDLKEFSKRRQQILNAAGSDATWAEREAAWTATRNIKQKINPHELKAKWKEEAVALGIKFVQPELAQPLLQQRLVSHENLEDAIAHCSERNVAFTQEDLEKFILNQGLATDVSLIEPLIQANSQLLSLSPEKRDFTTLAAVHRELATIKLTQSGQGKVNALAKQELVESHLEKTALNQDQRRAVLDAATTTDQFTAWQGVAGAGKTFALKELKAIAIASGYTIKGFAPSSMAAKVLSQELDIQALTVARLLVSEPPQEIEPNLIWVVDEAGLLSAKDALALLERATVEQARVLLVGDTKQLSAVEAGNPFKSLQQAGIKTSHLNESNRQRAPKLKLAVDLVAEGRIQEGFERLDENGYIQTVTPESKIEAIAADYIKSTPEERTQTLVLAGTNFERLAITQAIREHLKAEGSLGTATNITQLQAKDLTSVQMRYTHNFELGDMVMPTRSYKRRGLSKGELYEVVGKDTDRLLLKATDGKQLEVDTGFRKAVYQRQSIEIAKSDRLRWTKNDRQLGRRNGQEFFVTAIEGNHAQIQYLDSGLTESLNLQQAQHLDYAIVSTTYSSQGKTADSVLIAADQTIGQESFYVAVSRARYSLKLYTEDKDNLLALAQLSKAKENALVLLRQKELEKQHQSKLEKEQVTNAVIVARSPEAEEREVEAEERRSGGAEEQFYTESSPLPPYPSIPLPSPSPLPPCPSAPLPSPSPLHKSDLAEEPNSSQERPAPLPSSAPLPPCTPAPPPPVPTQPPVIKKPVPKTAQPKVAFWTPSNVGEAPERLDSRHWRELVEDSAIHPDIVALNFKSLHQTLDWEHEAWEYLMYSDKLPRTNTGRLSNAMISKYAHIEDGGWWCDAGVNAKSFAYLKPGDKPDRKLWGCYKPNNPREKADKPGKFIKYEHPPKTELSIFLLDVPDDIAESIYEKFGVQPSECDRASGFWYCVWKHNLPVTITEGAKKAASLLSQGHPAIGLPGIYAGYRSKDELGEKMKARLMDELAVFATPEREISFCFDYETRTETQRNIEIAISRTGRLLEEQGARVSVVTLPGPNKGVDDLIAAMGSLAYEKAYSEALTLKAWRDNNNQQRHASPAPPKKLSIEERKQRLQQRLEEPTTFSAFAKAIDELTNQELLYLEQAVKEYFSDSVAKLPPTIDRQAISSQINQLQQQLDSLWIEHAIQEKAIRVMEYFPLHKLSNKYNSALNKQLETIETIKELFTQKQNLESTIQQWESQVQNHETWEKEQKTLEMKTIADVLKSPPLQERLTNIKEELWRKEQEKIAKTAAKYEQSPKPTRGMRR
ncbi:relaxase domain-containing protein (plasmid) [Tolypothrix sp. PCC 7712]|uniref:MobF family relaxase n=2 Tax=unclassified Tolypothrix TaxID=2649714 RepID=UPI000B622377|nr:MobF family relaxase [Tolypothrix sp. PCC 7712]UYD30730.1 relaxase domain-containing protein [Tolypothrix sp. PCC 7712]BAY95699.1 mobilization protein TraI-like protein [Microchaete diplosiphon NIES-3275]